MADLFVYRCCWKQLNLSYKKQLSEWAGTTSSRKSGICHLLSFPHIAEYLKASWWFSSFLACLHCVLAWVLQKAEAEPKAYGWEFSWGVWAQGLSHFALSLALIFCPTCWLEGKNNFHPSPWGEEGKFNGVLVGKHCWNQSNSPALSNM